MTDIADAMLRERLRTHATHATAGRGSVQDGCTLADAEREAVEYAAAFIHDKGLHRQSPSMVADADTLRQLLRRLK